MQRWFALIAAFLIAGCTTVGNADAQGTSDSPPLIAGRVAVAEGDAQIWRVEEDGDGLWDDAVVNDVVTAGAGLYTGADGRNEVRVGPHTFRLAPASRGGFSQLDYSTAVFDLEYGTLNVRLARPEHGESTAVTVAGTRLDLVAPGRYRIDATDRGPVRLTVFEGHGTVRGAANTVGVGAGQAVVVQPGASGIAYEQAVSTDFDQWAYARDSQYQQARSAQYVSPYMTGYEELDRYGDWTPDATYGVVWYPRAVPTDWAPYRHGQWRWVRPWGWTWVDYAPWGYAPFHYGRWVMVGPRWCWVPGGYIRRPVWAPALVGFVGTSVGISVGVGPTVGWYPLAPWHRYEPHYRHGPTYVTVINQTIIQRPPHGVSPHGNRDRGATIVPGSRFREPIHRVALPVQPRPEQLKPTAPPPLNVAPAPRSGTRKFAEHERPGAPAAQPTTPGRAPQAVVPPGRGVGVPPAVADPTPGRAPAPKPVPPPQAGSPTRVAPPMVAEPMPGRGVKPQPPMPGNDPAPLNQPPGLRRGQPPAPPPAAPVVPPVTERERPQPRPHLPSDQLPPGRPQPTNPAEPPRFPPGAPPTIRQPQAVAPAPRPVQPAPVAAPTAPPVQAAPARPTPPVAVPTPVPARGQPPQSQKEQVLRGHPDERGNRPEREAPPGRAKQPDR